jgi:hypothetical protein
MRSQKYAMLKQQLAVAAQFEVKAEMKFCNISIRRNLVSSLTCTLGLVLQDYKEAAKLRDSLRSFEEKEPMLCLAG